MIQPNSAKWRGVDYAIRRLCQDNLSVKVWKGVREVLSSERPFIHGDWDAGSHFIGAVKIMDSKCHVPLFVKNASVQPSEYSEVITLHVTGMGCVNCANRVHNRLIDHPAVIEADVNHTTGDAVVTFLSGQITVSDLVVLVAEAGDYRHTYRAMLQVV